MKSRRIPWKLLLLGAAVALPAPAAPPQDAAVREINWRTDYRRAATEAVAKRLPLVIDFGTKSCSWCKILDQTTFHDPKVVALMNERFIPLKIDADVDTYLTSYLQISSYPTVVLASSDGKILGTIVGYKEAGEFHEHLQRALASTGSPDWMQRDLQVATKWMESGNYAQAIAVLRPIINDGNGRPVQASAEKLMGAMELKAGERLSKARDLQNKGQAADAVAVLTDMLRVFPGLQAARDASEMMAKINQSPEVRKLERGRRARELLTQAREFYKNREYIPCLDRCEWLVGSYGDLAEGMEASHIVNEIKSNPAWLQSAADIMSDRLGGIYLALADSLLKKNQPQQAEACLQRVIQAFPGSRQAESAAIRLGQLQGLPTNRLELGSAAQP